MKRKNIILLALAVALVLTASVQSAISYFTTYAEAKGGYPLTLGDTFGRETFTDWTKHLTITSEPEAQPVYVRAKAFAGAQFTLTYSGEKWTLGDDGYYYYEDILLGGESTTQLDIRIDSVNIKDVEGQHFNVVVVYERTPVQYDETTGEPYPDWSVTMGEDE